MDSAEEEMSDGASPQPGSLSALLCGAALEAAVSDADSAGTRDRDRDSPTGPLLELRLHVVALETRNEALEDEVLRLESRLYEAERIVLAANEKLTEAGSLVSGPAVSPTATADKTTDSTLPKIGRASDDGRMGFRADVVAPSDPRCGDKVLSQAVLESRVLLTEDALAATKLELARVLEENDDLRDAFLRLQREARASRATMHRRVNDLETVVAMQQAKLSASAAADRRILAPSGAVSAADAGAEVPKDAVKQRRRAKRKGSRAGAGERSFMGFSY